MDSKKAVAVAVPAEALAQFAFAPVHYADAFRIALSENRPSEMTALAHDLFGRRDAFPAYVSWLLSLRNILIRPFNIKSTMDVEKARDGGVAFFELLQETDNEVVLGEDDGHLDLRLSLLKTHEGERSYLTVTTFVRIHNLVGRCYFAMIKPFHKRIVMATMGKALG